MFVARNIFVIAKLSLTQNSNYISLQTNRFVCKEDSY